MEFLKHFGSLSSNFIAYKVSRASSLMSWLGCLKAILFLSSTFYDFFRKNYTRFQELFRYLDAGIEIELFNL